MADRCEKVIDDAILSILEDDNDILAKCHTIRDAYVDWICYYNVDEEPRRPPKASDIYDKIANTSAVDYLTLTFLERMERIILEDNARPDNDFIIKLQYLDFNPKRSTLSRTRE